MTDSAQEQFERSVGDDFIHWFNARVGSQFFFDRRADIAPDLIYSGRSSTLAVEVTTAYYDEADARMKWLNARGHPNAPSSCSGSNVSQHLAENIEAAIISKCEMFYGPDCMLVVHVKPAVHTAEQVESLISELRLPVRIPYRGVYVSGDFGWSTGGGTAGYRCFPVWGELCVPGKGVPTA